MPINLSSLLSLQVNTIPYIKTVTDTDVIVSGGRDMSVFRCAERSFVYAAIRIFGTDNHVMIRGFNNHRTAAQAAFLISCKITLFWFFAYFLAGLLQYSSAFFNIHIFPYFRRHMPASNAVSNYCPSRSKEPPVAVLIKIISAKIIPTTLP